ncbi:PHP domain protein [Labilithrix luteola]|uniref:PHP domain protein n=2 Tax=Labilithrix luteola TaxID=1391654 RepID=A0A0K1Q7A8_9BACT|nr:PHP domain protein [Labilithrix luteola]
MVGRVARIAFGAAPMLALFVVACPKPHDAAPPSKAARTATPAAKAPSRARVHPMKPGEALGGPNATGRPGDWVLENDDVVFVVDALGRGGGFAESGGNIVDAADAHVRKDELGQLFTYFGTFPRQGVYTAISSREEPDGTAVVEARGHELYEAGVEVVTEYRLAPGDRALAIRTTLHNRGDAVVDGLGLGDAIQWGGVDKFAPGKSVGFKGPSESAFLGGLGRFTSYAITSTEGQIGAISGGAWSDTEQKRTVTLGPGQSVTYERILLVGQRPDVSSLVAELAKASGAPVGPVAIALVDANGRAVRVARGAKAIVATPSGEPVMTIVAATDGESFGGELPEGDWTLSFAPSAGRRGNGTKVPVVVKKGAVAKATLAVTDVGSLRVGCTDVSSRVLPCKVTVEGTSGTETPDFGPSHVAAGAKNQLFTQGDARTVALAPGSYRLTFTRGPEYAAETMDVVVSAGGTQTVAQALRRVVDTTGYVSTDFHQHTMLSADAGISTTDRIVANAAEGVEVAVATEHNVVADLEPLVRELGLAPMLVEIAGNELTTDASKKPWGHANVFPLIADPHEFRGGATPVRDRTAREVFADVRALPGRPLIQVNHPRSGSNGYFDQLGFDRRTGEGTAPGYDPAFDSLEVWNGRNVEARTKILDDFFALLRTKHPVTPIADTDTHGLVGHEPGFPRTWVRVTKDDALDQWDRARSDDLVRGVRTLRDVVLSNGPFLQVTANGEPIGSIARTKGGVANVKVRVVSAPFVAVDRVEIRAAGDAKAAKSFVDVVPKKDESGAMVAEASFTIRASSDDAFIVIASGKRPMRPMMTGDEREIAPWAMTSPIWLDADGDGESLGR